LHAAAGDLAKELRRRKKLCLEFLDEEVWNWAAQGLDALSYLQSMHIVHRDVKPSNLLLSPEGVLMLTDFGVSDGGPDDITEDGEQLRGTPLYLSPEVLEGRTATHKADIWAFGVVIYELLMQALPFEGKTFAEIEKDLPEDAMRWRKRDPHWMPPKGGESLVVMEQRVRQTLDELAAKHMGQHIVWVTHGGVLDILYRLATGQSLQSPRTWGLRNTAINRLLWTPEGLQLVGWADERHLDNNEARDENNA
jgi:serine/threonine protein kinase